jgi:two-component system C4-dicarboxylate transport sensor histidine kinase DctB
MQGALGTEFGLKRPLDRRAYYYAAPAFGADGRVRGALIVAVDVEAVERTWSGSVPAVYFTDQVGTVFVSNRSEILGWKTARGSSAIAPREDAQARISRIGEHEIWTMDWGPYLPKRALHLVRPLPVIGMTGEVLLDVAPARRLAALQAAVVAAVLLAFGAILFLATERRRTLARANAVLESRVAERTRALSQTNAQLRREVAEREEAEAALKRAQADLVRAGKLTALGQMSAGISHELNQPLMAIQSFAENARQFIDRGQTEVAAGNLARISDLARRMGRIIRNLRAFARQESEPAARVDIVKTLEAAVELTQARLGRDGITLNWTPPADPIWVRGGEVRLSQVFVNLVTNAADAMIGSESPEITIRIRQVERSVTVDVLDTGPGIDDPEKIFDPFYSTKEVGASEGMGLGLSISYGMVQSFGGDIHGRNRAAGGAVFTVTLAAWDEAQEVAA